MSGIPVPHVFSTVTDLGDAKHAFKQSVASKLVNVLAVLAGVLIALAIVYYGLVVYPRTYPNVSAQNTPWILGFGLIILLGSLYMAWRTAARWHHSAVLYGDGFAHFDGKSLLTFKWDEIDSVLMKIVRMSYAGIIPAGTQRDITISGRSGVLRLDSTLSGVDGLISTVREKTFPHILDRSRGALDAGQPVQFGPLALSKAEGISMGRRRAAWADVTGVVVNNGIVEVKAKKAGLFSGISAPVASIPNVDVFLALVKDLAKPAQ